MDKNVNFRLDSGTYMIVEANAEKNKQTVSDWLRAAVKEQIKRTVDSRILDRLDERVHRIDKGMAEVKVMLVKLQEAVDEIVPLEE
jgi:cobalamin biosynthesis protein CbiD